MSDIDYYKDRFCPVFNKIIDCELCYECVMALFKYVKISSVPELKNVKNIDEAILICEKCKYSNLS